MPLQVYRFVGVFVVSSLFLVGLMAAPAGRAHEEDDTKLPKTTPPVAKNEAKATFAGGCFWCMEPPFDELDGVTSTTSGYTGGKEKNPSYKQVSRGKTGHTEAVRVIYNPNIITYAELLDVFWRNIDPTTSDRQFCDWGKQYRTGIFYHDEAQKQLAEASKDAIIASGRIKSVVTEITAASDFWEAEDYHQDYYLKNPDNYKQYRFGCGRDQRLRQLWGEAPSH